MWSRLNNQAFRKALPLHAGANTASPTFYFIHQVLFHNAQTPFRIGCWAPRDLAGGRGGGWNLKKTIVPVCKQPFSDALALAPHFVHWESWKRNLPIQFFSGHFFFFQCLLFLKVEEVNPSLHSVTLYYYHCCFLSVLCPMLFLLLDFLPASTSLHCRTTYPTYPTAGILPTSYLFWRTLAMSYMCSIHIDFSISFDS